MAEDDHWIVRFNACSWLLRKLDCFDCHCTQEKKYVASTWNIHPQSCNIRSNACHNISSFSNLHLLSGISSFCVLLQVYRMSNNSGFGSKHLYLNCYGDSSLLCHKPVQKWIYIATISYGLVSSSMDLIYWVGGTQNPGLHYKLKPLHSAVAGSKP